MNAEIQSTESKEPKPRKDRFSNLEGRAMGLEFLRLRAAGISWDDIAKQYDYAEASGPINLVKNHLANIESEQHEHYRAIQTERLEGLIMKFDRAAKSLDPGALSMYLRTTDQLNKLHGLYPKEMLVIAPIRTGGEMVAQTPSEAYSAFLGAPDDLEYAESQIVDAEFEALPPEPEKAPETPTVRRTRVVKLETEETEEEEPGPPTVGDLLAKGLREGKK